MQLWWICVRAALAEKKCFVSKNPRVLDFEYSVVIDGERQQLGQRFTPTTVHAGTHTHTHTLTQTCMRGCFRTKKQHPKHRQTKKYQKYLAVTPICHFPALSRDPGREEKLQRFLGPAHRQRRPIWLDCKGIFSGPSLSSSFELNTRSVLGISISSQ